MQREARIYMVYALMAVALLAYATSVAAEAWSRFGASGTFAVCAVLAALLALFAMLAAWLWFIFATRAVISVRAVPTGYELYQSKLSQVQATAAHQVKHLRTIGKQLASDESAPAFVIFTAAGKVWVTEASTFQGATGGASP